MKKCYVPTIWCGKNTFCNGKTTMLTEFPLLTVVLLHARPQGLIKLIGNHIRTTVSSLLQFHKLSWRHGQTVVIGQQHIKKDFINHQLKLG
jgi:hypothetical protein